MHRKRYDDGCVVKINDRNNSNFLGLSGGAGRASSDDALGGSLSLITDFWTTTPLRTRDYYRILARYNVLCIDIHRHEAL